MSQLEQTSRDVLSRRQFFKVCATGLATSSVVALGFTPNAALAEVREFKLSGAKETRNTCPYCSVSCGVLLTVTSARAYEPISHYSVQSIEGWHVYVHRDLMPGGKHREDGEPADEIKKLLKEYPNDVKLVFKHYHSAGFQGEYLIGPAENGTPVADQNQGDAFLLEVLAGP